MNAKKDKTDAEVISLIIDGKKNEYSTIVERYQAPLLRYARTIVKDEDNAADVVQEAFIKAYRNLRSFQLDRKFSSWIYRITHNEAINFIKKHRRELRPDDESWFDTIPDTAKTADEEMQVMFEQKLARNAVSMLEIKYREPIILYAFENKSYKEIAQILRIPTATVGTRISRGKSQLKKIVTSLKAKGGKL